MDYSLLVGLHTLSSAQDTSANDGVPMERAMCSFYQDSGGFRATFEDNSPANEVYYLGVIDILTPYAILKRLEHAVKALVLPRNAISAVNPVTYARRFLKFMGDNILQNVESDYGRRALPTIPAVMDETEDEKEGGWGAVMVREMTEDEDEDED